MNHKRHKSTYDVLELLKTHRRFMLDARQKHRRGKRLTEFALQEFYKNVRNMESLASELEGDGLKDLIETQSLRIASMEGVDYFNKFWSADLK